ncbi:restriction endonuclease subunit S [Thiocapsa marina]|uniref:Restriction modification system DNA specificity domain protein n=1 Tax=Thiocapsa marina 5811 TaxID=768671 RepID=F9UDD0_9GAMM|nr:restriction endonuclease subunit S [Thiocapsa marina]EGV17874.1 restriction modification system DNA specificity domain protein [Thiocapsa marina 5811]
MSFSHDVADLVARSNDPLHNTADWWQRIPLGDVCNILNGFPFQSQYFNGSGGAPVIRIRDVTSGMCATFYSGEIPEGYWVEPSDMVIGMDGDFNCRLWPSERGLLNQRVCKLTPQEDFLEKKFVSYALPGYLRLINEHTHSITVKHLSSKTISKIPFPLPPRAEQRRIVSKLDSLFERTRRAREELSHIPRLIESYKKAILEAAFRGDLTRSFREKNNLSAWETKPLHSLIADGPTNGYSPRAGDNPSGTLSLKLTATTRGFLDLSERAIKRLSDVIPEDSQYWLQDGDILVQRANSLEYVGATAIFRGPPKTYIYPDLMMRLRVKDDVLRQYLWRFLNSPDARSYFKNHATGTAGNMPKINGRTLKALPVPMPSELEMPEVVERIETKLAYVESTTSEYTRAVSLLNHLDQANLAKAFRGELVSQDPSDEPASVLLERICAARAEQTKNTRRGRGKTANARVAA